MIASKVTISPNLLDRPTLRGRRKSNLRRKVIIEYIQSKPAGTVIRLTDFQVVGRFNNAGSTLSCIKAMIREGVINRYEADKPRQYYYSVTGAVRTHKLIETDGVVQPRPPMRLHEALLPLAKDFVWERTSDSLREFIAYVEGRE